MSKLAIPLAVRRDVALMAGAIPGETTTTHCVYCGVPGEIFWPMLCRSNRPSGWVTFPGLELDHKIPESRGGPMTAENIVLACRSCNRRKGTRVHVS
jgi:5-methylcytosine-specific restriction endonuclease McrA